MGYVTASPEENVMSLYKFATMALPDTNSLDEAVDHYARIGRVQVAPVTDRAFAYSGRILPSALLAVGDLSVSACLVTRTHTHAAEGNSYDVLGIVLDAGEVEVQLDRRKPFRYGRGEAFLWQGDEAGCSRYLSPETRLLNIALPRAVIETALLDAESVSGRRLAASAELRLLAMYAAAFLDAYPQLGPDAVDAVQCHLQDLALLALGARHDPAESARLRGGRAARFHAIRTDIERHLCDPGLSVSWLLARHPMSERTLRALFADAGTTFTDYVRDRRLALAYRRLIDPAQAARPISAIAYASGFCDLSGFNRAFRRRFGISPSEGRTRGSST